MISFNSSFVVKKDDFSATRILRSSLPTLEKSQILLKICKFGFSANNITYLAMGKSYKYFDFFPVENDDSLAICPVWSLAEVVQSKNSDLKVGEKIYGYFPFAQFCILQPSGPITNLFFHVSRPQLSADRRVYNQYFRSKSDPDYSKDQEDYMCLFRPLWTTSFFLDDFLREYNLFKAERVIISSASSKTSYCLALILNNRGIKPIGLTSTGNVGFVESLGWYAQVFDYNEIHKMDNTVKLVYIDTAGSSRLNVLVHDHFKDNLVKHVGVGLSHYSQENVVDSKLEKIETSKFEMFFAPGWIKIRMPKAKEELLARKDKEWKKLLKEAKRCVKLVQGHGYEQATSIYNNMLLGKARAEEGYIMSLWERPSKL